MNPEPLRIEMKPDSIQPEPPKGTKNPPQIGMNPEPKRIEMKPDPVPVPPTPPVVAQNQQPGISFFEVVAKTDTVHIGNIEGKMHSMAHAPLFKTGIISSLKKGDPVGAITGFLSNTFSSLIMFGPKLVSKAVCAARGTNKKVKELQDNIANLSPEEFRVLTEDNGALDYSLNPTTMIQFKFNDKYLEAIKGRVESERQDEKRHFADACEQCDTQIQAIQQELAKGTYSQAEVAILQKQLSVLSRQRVAFENEAQKAESKRLAFEDGMELKSSRKKNIPGWIAAVRNPDNIRDHVQMAHYSEERRKARESGDYAREVEVQQAMDQYITEQTSMKFTHISRGKYQKAAVDFSASRESQTKGREILSSAAIVSSILTAYRAFEIEQAKVESQADLDAAIQKHNQEISGHNADLTAHNQRIQGSGAQTIDDETISGAVRYQQYSDAANVRTQQEVEALNVGAVETGAGWRGALQKDSTLDDAIHAGQQTLVNPVAKGSSQQTYIDSFNDSVNSMTQTMQQARAAEVGYQSVGGHAPFDVTQYLDATANAPTYAEAFKDFFAQSLRNNEALTRILSETPVSMAPTMEAFTINIPSAMIPAFATVMATVAHSYQESDQAAKKVIREHRKRKDKGTQEQAQETQDKTIKDQAKKLQAQQVEPDERS